MGDQVAKAEIERSRFVLLSTGKNIEVLKWNLIRRNQASKLVREFMATIPKDADGNSKVSGDEFLDLFTGGAGSQRMLDLMKLSVAKDDVDHISEEMLADDSDNVTEAMVALNGGALKKSLGLPNQFLRILAGLNQ